MSQFSHDPVYASPAALDASARLLPGSRSGGRPRSSPRPSPGADSDGVRGAGGRHRGVGGPYQPSYYSSSSALDDGVEDDAHLPSHRSNQYQYSRYPGENTLPSSSSGFSSASGHYADGPVASLSGSGSGSAFSSGAAPTPAAAAAAAATRSRWGWDRGSGPEQAYTYGFRGDTADEGFDDGDDDGDEYDEDDEDGVGFYSGSLESFPHPLALPAAAAAAAASAASGEGDGLLGSKAGAAMTSTSDLAEDIYSKTAAAAAAAEDSLGSSGMYGYGSVRDSSDGRQWGDGSNSYGFGYGYGLGLGGSNDAAAAAASSASAAYQYVHDTIARASLWPAPRFLRWAGGSRSSRKRSLFPLSSSSSLRMTSSSAKGGHDLWRWVIWSDLAVDAAFAFLLLRLSLLFLLPPAPSSAAAAATTDSSAESSWIAHALTVAYHLSPRSLAPHWLLPILDAAAAVTLSWCAWAASAGFTLRFACAGLPHFIQTSAVVTAALAAALLCAPPPPAAAAAAAAGGSWLLTAYSAPLAACVLAARAATAWGHIRCAVAGVARKYALWMLGCEAVVAIPLFALVFLPPSSSPFPPTLAAWTGTLLWVSALISAVITCCPPLFFPKRAYLPGSAQRQAVRWGQALLLLLVASVAAAVVAVPAAVARTATAAAAAAATKGKDMALPGTVATAFAVSSGGAKASPSPSSGGAESFSLSMLEASSHDLASLGSSVTVAAYKESSSPSRSSPSRSSPTPAPAPVMVADSASSFLSSVAPPCAAAAAAAASLLLLYARADAQPPHDCHALRRGPLRASAWTVLHLALAAAFVVAAAGAGRVVGLLSVPASGAGTGGKLLLKAAADAAAASAAAAASGGAHKALCLSPLQLLASGHLLALLSIALIAATHKRASVRRLVEDAMSEVKPSFLLGSHPSSGSDVSRGRSSSDTSTASSSAPGGSGSGSREGEGEVRGGSIGAWGMPSSTADTPYSKGPYNQGPYNQNPYVFAPYAAPGPSVNSNGNEAPPGRFTSLLRSCWRKTTRPCRRCCRHTRYQSPGPTEETPTPSKGAHRWFWVSLRLISLLRVTAIVIVTVPLALLALYGSLPAPPLSTTDAARARARAWGAVLLVVLAPAVLAAAEALEGWAALRSYKRAVAAAYAEEMAAEAAAEAAADAEAEAEAEAGKGLEGDGGSRWAGVGRINAYDYAY